MKYSSLCLPFGKTLVVPSVELSPTYHYLLFFFLQIVLHVIFSGFVYNRKHKRKKPIVFPYLIFKFIVFEILNVYVQQPVKNVVKILLFLA